MESWEELLHVCAGTEEIIQQMKDHRILDEAGRSIVSSLLAGCGDAVKLLIQISTLGYILFGMFGVPLKDRNILPRALRILFSEWGRANYRMQQGNKKNIAEKSKALNNPPPQKKLGRGIESRSLKRDGFCVCKGAKEETLHKNEQLGYKWPCWLIFIWSKAVQCRSSQSHAGTVNSDLPTGCPRL